MFTERSVQLPPRERVTLRLRERVERAASGSLRAVRDAGREYGVSDWTVHRALVAKAEELAGVRAGQLPPVTMLGLDETRARSVRWVFDADDAAGPDAAGPEAAGRAGGKPAGRWLRSDPWMTSCVDLDTSSPGWLLGLALGRSGASVERLLGGQSQLWREAVQVVALDPSAPFAAAVRRLLPNATIVVDHWHLPELFTGLKSGPFWPCRNGERCP